MPSPFGTNAGVHVAAPMPDGGIVGTIGGDDCRTARFTSDGRIRWTAAYCNEAVADADAAARQILPMRFISESTPVRSWRT